MRKFLIISSILLILLVIIFLIKPKMTGNSLLEIPLTALAISNQNAPSDRIPESNIEVYKDKIIIRIENASLSEYADTNSMIPSFDTGANGILIIPKSEYDIQVGDIITFESENKSIVHRVVEIGSDDNGKYFITKGDNALLNDGKIRFEQIKYITIGVIY